jgi:hypothetical protein
MDIKNMNNLLHSSTTGNSKRNLFAEQMLLHIYIVQVLICLVTGS